MQLDTTPNFLCHYMGTVAAALIPVILTAFICLPATFHWHDDPTSQGIPTTGHMT